MVDFTSLVPKKQIRKVGLYDPWKNERISMGENSVVSLPTFKRSIVIRIDKQ